MLTVNSIDFKVQVCQLFYSNHNMSIVLCWFDNSMIFTYPLPIPLAAAIITTKWLTNKVKTELNSVCPNQGSFLARCHIWEVTHFGYTRHTHTWLQHLYSTHNVPCLKDCALLLHNKTKVVLSTQIYFLIIDNPCPTLILNFLAM